VHAVSCRFLLAQVFKPSGEPRLGSGLGERQGSLAARLAPGQSARLSDDFDREAAPSGESAARPDSSFHGIFL